MNNLKIAVLAIVVLVLVLLLHIYGMSSELYITTWYYDIIMHILGGIGISLAVFYVFKNPKYIIPLTILAGIAWELFEIYYNIAGARLWTKAYYLDTAKDLLDDFLGSAIVFTILKLKFNKIKNE